MKIVSIDVGIKNLACCVLSVEAGAFEVVAWEVLDLCPRPACACGKPGLYRHQEGPPLCRECSKQHRPKYLRPTPAVLEAFKAPLQLPKLIKVCALCAYPVDTAFTEGHSPSVTALKKLARELRSQRLLDAIPEPQASMLSLPDTAARLHVELRTLLQSAGPIDRVLIENQMGPQAVRMKGIQAMVCQWFVMLGVDPSNIVMVSPRLKLANFEQPGEKTSYADRKSLAVAACGRLLAAEGKNAAGSVLAASSKADDLADSMLQALAHLHAAGELALTAWKQGRGLLKIK